MVSVSDPFIFIAYLLRATHWVFRPAFFVRKKKLTYPTHLSAPKTVEWLGRYAQFSGIGPIYPGRRGGLHGDDLQPKY